MAPKAGQATGTATAAQRRTAISAVRGVSLALHAASGLTQGLDLEATRLLRVCEGLARAAAGCLEALGRASLPAGSAGGGVPKKAGVDTNTKLNKDSGEGKKKKKRIRNKGKGMKIDQAGSVTAAALDAAAPVFVPEFSDEWADSVSVGPSLHLAPLPAAAQVAGTVRPPRVLVPRRSGSRSPHRKNESEQLDQLQSLPKSECAPAPLLEGHIAAIKNLSSRPELAGALVLLGGFDESSARWGCMTRDKECLRIKPDKLQSMAPAFQKLARQKFDAV